MDPRTAISPNFNLGELLDVKDHPDLHQQQLAALTPEFMLNACKVAWSVLEPLRMYCGNKPVITTSWFRGDRLNKRVKGSASSQHRTARAVDFKIPAGNMFEAFDALHALGVGQRIIYLSDDGKTVLWIHASIPEDNWTWNAKTQQWDTPNGPRDRSLICYPAKDPKKYHKLDTHPRWQKKPAVA